MKTIRTKYLPATDTKGARIKASAEGVPSIVISYYDGDGKNPHAVAAKKLKDKMGWQGKMIGGGNADGSMTWVFEGDISINPRKKVKKAKRKFSRKQLAAQKRFAKMARSGTFKKSKRFPKGHIHPATAWVGGKLLTGDAARKYLGLGKSGKSKPYIFRNPKLRERSQTAAAQFLREARKEWPMSTPHQKRGMRKLIRAKWRGLSPDYRKRHSGVKKNPKRKLGTIKTYLCYGVKNGKKYYLQRGPVSAPVFVSDKHKAQGYRTDRLALMTIKKYRRVLARSGCTHIGSEPR